MDSLFIVLDGKTILTNSLIKKSLSDFWKDNIIPFLRKNDNTHIAILFRVVFIDGRIVTIGEQQKLNSNDLQSYIDYIIDRLGLLNDSYPQDKIIKLIFSYASREGVAFANIIKSRELITHTF